MDYSLFIEVLIVGHLVVCNMRCYNQYYDYNKQPFLYIPPWVFLWINSQIALHKRPPNSLSSYQWFLSVYLLPPLLVSGNYLKEKKKGKKRKEEILASL